MATVVLNISDNVVTFHKQEYKYNSFIYKSSRDGRHLVLFPGQRKGRDDKYIKTGAYVTISDKLILSRKVIGIVDVCVKLSKSQAAKMYSKRGKVLPVDVDVYLLVTWPVTLVPGACLESINRGSGRSYFAKEILAKMFHIPAHLLNGPGYGNHFSGIIHFTSSTPHKPLLVRINGLVRL